MTPMSLALHVRDLEVHAPNGRVLVRARQLDVAPGETVGLRGPSGAGKSSLLYALAGLQARMSGAVVWGDTDLTPLNDHTRARFRRQYMGMIFQDFLLFEELGALNNASLAAAFGAPAERHQIRHTARTLLQRLGLTDLGRTVESFSGGERQRVAVARALSNNPKVILADEPTASLDRAAADTLIADLTRMARDEGRTLVVVSHDDSLLSQLDRVLQVVDGELKQETRHV